MIYSWSEPPTPFDPSLSCLLRRYTYFFSNTPEEHLHHIAEVVSVLVQNDLYVRFEKCLFLRNSLGYLGFSVQGRTDTTPGGTSISPSKTKISEKLDWPVQSFLGFVNFYWRRKLNKINTIYDFGWEPVLIHRILIGFEAILE